MSKTTDLIVKILVDDSDTAKFDKAGDKAANFGTSLARTTMVGAATFGGIAYAVTSFGGAAAEAEQSQQQLQFALDQFPATADTSAASLEKLNSQLALKTQFDDDAYASGQAILAQYGLTGAQIERLTPLLGDYAAKTGKDLPTAAADLGKAMMGQGRALKAIGVDFTDTGSLAGNYDQLIAGLTTQVDGFAVAQGETATGSAAIMNNALGEVQENLGKGLLPLLVDVTGAFAEFAGWAAENTGTIKIIAIVVAGIAVALTLLSAAQTVSAGITAVSTMANSAWAASMWAALWPVLAVVAAIALLAGGVFLIIKNWDTIGPWLKGLWDGFVGIVQDGIGKVWNLFTTFTPLGILIDNFGPAVDWVGNKVDDFVGFFTSIPGRVGDLAGNVGGLMMGVAHTVASGIAWMWNHSVGALGFSLPGWIPGIGGKSFSVPDIKVPALAAGGIVTGPTLALIGEAGPEVVAPLSRASEFGLGGGSVEVPVVIKLDGSVIARVLKRVKLKEDW